MEMWSEGLGKIELEVNFSKYWVEDEDDGTCIKGVTIEPVQWDFKATFLKEDVPGLLNIFFKFKTWLFLLMNIHYIFLFLFEKVFNRKRYAPEVTTK